MDYIIKIISEKEINHFYRYRPDKDYEVDTLENKQIYLCKPIAYEDDEDCQIKIDEEDIIRHYLEHSGNGYKANNKLIDEVKRKIRNHPKWSKLMDSMRNDCLVACFTENYDNDYMWTKYANNSMGICVEYDIFELLNFIKEKKWVYMPIRYIKDRNKQKDIYFTSKEFNLDRDTVDEAILKYKLSCMTKNINPYYSEREWRLLEECPEILKKSTDTGMLYDFIKPKKIIMGKNIKENESFYKKVCEYKENNNNIEIVKY